MSALAISPGDLRWAARSLAGEADTGRRLVDEVVAAAPDDHSWGGLAGLAAARSREVWAAGLAAAAGPLEQVAAGLNGFASEVEQAQAQLRARHGRAEEGRAELSRLQTLLASTPDEATRAVLLLRRDHLTALVVQALQEAEAVEDQVRTSAARLAHELDAWGSDALSATLQELHRLRGAVVQTGKAGVQLVVSAQVLRWAVEHARSADLAVRAALLDDARLAARWVLTGARAGRTVSRFAVLKAPVVVWLTAVPDLVTGGGYTGGRAMTTRLLAGAALPASVGVFVPHPVVIGSSLAVLGAYSLWSAGNLLYDHRAVPARIGGELHRAGRAGAERLAGVVRRTGHAVDDGLSWARDRIDEGLRWWTGQEPQQPVEDRRPGGTIAPVEVVAPLELPPVPPRQLVPVGPLAVPFDPAVHPGLGHASGLDLRPGPAVPRLPVHPGPLVGSVVP